jgi:hypothetical protein
LLDLERGVGPKQMHLRFRALAQDPGILAAIQGTVAHRERVDSRWLAVLVADGGDASIDALVRHFDVEAAMRDRQLERLRDLRIHSADTPALRALFEQVDQELDKHHAAERRAGTLRSSSDR